MTLPYLQDRARALELIRTARAQPYDLSPWDVCVIAGTIARNRSEWRVYEIIKKLAIKFRPTENFYISHIGR